MTEYHVSITMLTGATHSLKTTDLDAANAFVDTYAIAGATSKVVITATTITETKEIFRKLRGK